MAEFGGMVDTAITKLKGCVDSYGRIIDGRESDITESIGTITGSLGIDMTTTTVTDPELGEYQAVQVGEHICTSPDDIYDEVYEAGGDMTVDNFFTGSSNLCAGILSTTGGEYLAKAFTFAAPNANLRFEKNSEDLHAYDVIGPDFKIKIEEAITGTRPARIYIYSEYAPYEYYTMEPFNSQYCYHLSTPLCFIRYYLYKGGSGDCYLKGYYSNDTTPFDQEHPEQAEEEFENVSMNILKGYVSANGSYVLEKDSKNYGGFSIVGVEPKMTKEKSEDEDYSFTFKTSSASNYATVVWKTDGSPLHVSLNSATRKWGKENANENCRRLITNSSNQILALAPLFTPGSHEFGSINSYWSMVIFKDGTYDLSVTDGLNYRYDHGFVLSTG